MRYVFGAYTLDPDRYELCRAGEVIPLQPQVFKVLTYLVQHRDRVLSKQELLDHLWPETVVSEAALERCIRLARQALGNGPGATRVIQTLHRRGYRLVAPVTECASEALPAPQVHPPELRPASPLAPADQSCLSSELASSGSVAAALCETAPNLFPVPGRCTDCGCDHPVGARFCTACGLPLLQRCPHCGCAHLQEAQWCSACATSLPTPTPPVPVQTARPRAQQPEQAAPGGPRSTGQRPPEAERRQLTVLVCRLVSVAEHAKPLDPEELLAVMQDYHALGAEVVHQFDGHIAQSQGDRLEVYFGYPQAHEDDARRAVHTGLRLVAMIEELNRRHTRARGVQFAVQVGIHTGIVVMGAMGQDGYTPLVLGETPTIAVQVQALAASGAVVIGPTTLRLVERYFVSQALRTSILEDAAEPLTVYQILHEGTTQSRFEVAVTKGLIPLVGREHEIGLLCERWTQVKDGLGQVVLLSGEAGIGKSRLVQELKERLAGEAHTRVECHCLPYYQNTALYPVMTHLQRFLRLTREDTAGERLHKLEEMLQPYGFILQEVVPLLAALLSLPLPDRYPPLTLTPQRQKQKTLEVLGYPLKAGHCYTTMVSGL
jgi:DNA-binding winged helix-turn-helix (wHTH) protein/class 3 adenylate cyclase